MPFCNGPKTPMTSKIRCEIKMYFALLLSDVFFIYRPFPLYAAMAKDAYKERFLGNDVCTV